uniref:Protein Vpu n=1 Tax=Human immunodeficiency virus type 1 TaxID=11676 RepID=A0A6C1A7J4_HV1|nr:vpu protein [Human immunodeficiency virus 1]QIC96865.1 vpu protein [Human immunodeficiency virus 1]QIC96874.1 vpu protein [Human immunodeficiency virus 1]QIC96882.1 vpu protein [Human immunodeficiency virus 1]QIC96891.1 vpu protein [Human immunodeficiency virus 1]
MSNLDALHIWAIVGLVVALIIAIVVWTIVGIEYKRLLRQRRIDRLIKRITERAEDSGNESDGDTEELEKLVEMGNYNLGNDDIL